MSLYCNKKITRVDDVTKWRLCVGCGACAVSCEKKNITIEDVCDQGLRPTVNKSGCDGCGKCIAVCPGLGISHCSLGSDELPLGLRNDWGPLLEVWEGYATDSEIRYSGSSGGAATAIALFCIENEFAGGVLHVGKDKEEPWRNKTKISQNRQDLISSTGSRYSPASPCDGLGMVESSSSPFVFIGKPCDIHGLRKLQEQRSQLKEKIGLAIGIFCAGTPATLGLFDLLAKLQVPREKIDNIRFRGKGWPGLFSVGLKGESDSSHKLSYAESWGFLNNYRPYRCYICPDGTSEFADISCGDPWYREPSGEDSGRSMILVRTPKGRDILEAAMKAGYLNMEKVGPEIIKLSQLNLLNKRRAVWGRIATMKAFGLPVPKYIEFSLFSNWMELSVRGKSRSIMGTARRIVKRKYYKHLDDKLSNP